MKIIYFSWLKENLGISEENVVPPKNINNIKGTQEIFNHRANMCSLAAQGKWSKELEEK